MEYIVFHELLHGVVPPVQRHGRTLHHPPAYRRAEQAYPDLARMKRMSRELLARIRRWERVAR